MATRRPPMLVHVRRRARGSTAWCGARAGATMLNSLDHAAELSSSGGDTETCAKCALVVAAAILAGARQAQPQGEVVVQDAALLEWRGMIPSPPADRAALDAIADDPRLAFEREVFIGVGRGIAQIGDMVPLTAEGVSMLRERTLAALRAYVRNVCHMRKDSAVQAEELASNVLAGGGL